MRPPRQLLSAALAALLLVEPAGGQAPESAAAAMPELGLMGTIPIFWGEAAGVGEWLDGGGEPHWARARLEASYRLRPLDTLDERSLAGLDRLLLAQPRALSPQENVALDAWVRAGGRLLLFADPMLSGESRFALGDRRRPQDVILLSPILDHWGLRLEFDVAAPEGTVVVEATGPGLPVNRPGRFAVAAEESACAVEATGVLARCAIGDGAALVLADAAVLDLYGPHPASGPALDWLVAQAFGETGKSRDRR